jgi:catechol 2,3-dioxygenase-like lactoylglutathione lyase family enzyme
MTRLIRTLALSSLALTLGAPSLPAEDAVPVFSKATADLGIVVRDIEASAKFYADVLGMTEVKGFSVDGEKASSFGLTDKKSVNVRVFVLDENAKARTSFKLMSFPDAPGAKQDQQFIHSTIGVSYLTLFVTDMKASLARLKKADVKLLGETPASLGGKNYITVFHDPDGNFIELIGPMEK